MAENTQLAAFLEDGRPPQAEPQAPTPEPQPAATTPEPKPDKPAPKTEAKTEADDDADAPPGPPVEGEDVVGFRAYENERKRRQDWKERAVRNEERAAANEARAALLERQLEEAKRAAAQPPPQQQYQPPPEIPNPAHDPQGYHNYLMHQQWEAQMHQHLNISEMHAVREHGEEKVEQMKREFLAAKERNPMLGQQLLQQKDPYGWAMKEMDKQRRMAEIGDDPAAYRARIEAELRASWEAGNQQQRGPGVPNMAPSLATARSVAGRTAQAWTGEPSLEDLVSSIQNRKKQRV